MFDTIERFLANAAAVRQPHATLGLCVYPVSRTPFVALDDFNDSDLRVYFVVHRHASLGDLDPASAEW